MQKRMFHCLFISVGGGQRSFSQNAHHRNSCTWPLSVHVLYELLSFAPSFEYHSKLLDFLFRTNFQHHKLISFMCVVLV